MSCIAPAGDHRACVGKDRQELRRDCDFPTNLDELPTSQIINPTPFLDQHSRTTAIYRLQRIPGARDVFAGTRES